MSQKWRTDADREFLRAAMTKHFSDKLSMDEIGNFIYDVFPAEAAHDSVGLPQCPICWSKRKLAWLCRYHLADGTHDPAPHECESCEHSWHDSVGEARPVYRYDCIACPHSTTDFVAAKRHQLAHEAKDQDRSMRIVEVGEAPAAQKEK